ncbi:MAG TPA: DciA family protein [Hyphomicrobiaceae bacterium]
MGSFVPALVREACRRRGFSNIDIVLRWREIVGPALADQTWPLRIEWPRRQEAVLRPDGTAEPGGQRTRLVVGAAPARALDVEYAKRDIVERVNRYLGYRAATELAAAPDYTVAPDERGSTPAAAPAGRCDEHDAPAAGGNDPLKAALARLGRGVAARGY